MTGRRARGRPRALTGAAQHRGTSISENLEARHPEIAWPKVAGIGSILRHAYPIVDDGVIRAATARDLPPWQAAVEAMPRAADWFGAPRRILSN